MSEQNKVEQAAYEAMRKAHAFCPSELSHLDKMRWMADYFLKNYSSQSPAPIPEQVAQAFGIEGLKKHTRSDGNFGLAEFYLAADVERLLATQSAQEITQQAAPVVLGVDLSRDGIAFVREQTLEEVAQLFDDSPHAEEFRCNIAEQIRALKVSPAAQQAAKAETVEQVLFWPHGATEVACSSCGLTMGESRLLSALKHGELSLAPTTSTVSASGALAAADDVLTPSAVLYCANCHTTYRHADGTCTDCGKSVFVPSILATAAQAATDKSED